METVVAHCLNRTRSIIHIYFWCHLAFIASSVKNTLTLFWICHLRYPPQLAVWTMYLYPVAESMSREKTGKKYFTYEHNYVKNNIISWHKYPLQVVRKF